MKRQEYKVNLKAVVQESISKFNERTKSSYQLVETLKQELGTIEIQILDNESKPISRVFVAGSRDIDLIQEGYERFIGTCMDSFLRISNKFQ
jgi:hypothetical protein